MFTREDYEKYFLQVAHVERKMVFGVYDLAREIDEPSLIKLLQKIGEDEIRHYGQVLKMLKLSLNFDHPETRRESRDYYGTVSLGSGQDPTGKGIKAYCVNLSKTGICLESTQELPVAQVLDLEIRLFNKTPVLKRQGRIVWSKKIEQDFYIGGMEFVS